ncbi:MAG: DUF4199 domain-containing protein [Bacteroidetes bacterium]|nr:MAG: DUF4199 domain-containing protein [Bacteroidota bacterium]
MSYGQSLANGTVLILIACFIYTFTLYLLLKFDGNLLDYLLDEMYNSLLESGMDEEQAEQFFAFLEKFATPFLFAASTFFGLFVNSFIFLLLISIFVKRTPKTPFEA